MIAVEETQDGQGGGGHTVGKGAGRRPDKKKWRTKRTTARVFPRTRLPILVQVRVHPHPVGVVERLGGVARVRGREAEVENEESVVVRGAGGTGDGCSEEVSPGLEKKAKTEAGEGEKERREGRATRGTRAQAGR